MTTFSDYFKQVTFMFTANEVAYCAPCSQCIRQCEAAHHMTSTYLDGSIAAEDDSHPCSALNSHSARSQSSGVSISCTRCLGKITGVDSAPKIIFSLSQAPTLP